MVSVKELWKVAIISSTTSALVLLGGYLVLAQTGTWSEPTATPPGNNALAPLNAGPAGQSKSGGLILNTGGAPNGLIVNSGATSLGGQLNMNSSKIVNLATPADTADAVNLGYLQSYVAAQSGGGGGFPSEVQKYNTDSNLYNAAKACRDMGGGWHLPSYPEAVHFVGQFGGWNWTSTLIGGGVAQIDLSNGNWTSQSVSNIANVICVR
jgi:hypothetical protein